MKRELRLRAILGAILSLTVVCQSQASLIHRYSFNETTGATIKDSVGTANGDIKGSDGSWTLGGGQLDLQGGVTSAADPVTGYVDLPNHIINVLTNVSIETWITWNGAGNWQRIFDFGTSAGGENVVDGNGAYLFLCPQGPNYLRFAVRDPATGTEPVQLTASAALELGVETCVTVTYDYLANVTRLYSNGVLLVTGPASVKLSTINDVNNWLGRSQWNDNMLIGAYNEFRIYDNALNPVEVAASYAAGTASPSIDASALGAVEAVKLTVAKTALLEGDVQETSASADFAKVKGVSLAGVSAATVTSDNSSVATVDSAGNIKAVGAGTAKITLAYSGKSSEASITVSRRQTGVAVAGALLVDLRAADTKTDATTWKNRVTTGDFTAEGAPAYVANVEGTGVAGVKFAGTDAYAGPITSADVEGNSDRSIEVWVFNPVLADEETLISWGHRGGPARSNMSFNYGANGSYGAVGHWDEDVGWNGNPVAGVWHHLAYTYDGSKVRVYADGVLKNTRSYTAGLDTYVGFPFRVGAQTLTDGSGSDFGQSLNGYLGLVRVHGGALSDSDVKNNFLYGIELTDPGTLQGVTLKLETNAVVGAGSRVQASVFATYAGRSYFYVSPGSSFESSDPAIATVDANGLVTTKALGTVTIKAIYQGKESTQSLQVLGKAPTKIIHRYSFNEKPGTTTVADSVGTAHGTVKGLGADFNGTGQLVLPGGGSSSASEDTVSGYVDLPNHIINTLTDASFEVWVTWTGGSAWERIFDLGTSGGGENIVDGNGAYIFLSPMGSANLRFAVRDPATGTEPVQLTASTPPPTATEFYAAVVYNYLENTSALYSNAVKIVTGPASVSLKTINDVNNWLGRSQWGDPMFSGSYNEFRIYDGALTDAEIAASYAAGPNKLAEGSPQFSGIVKNTDGSITIQWTGGGTLQSASSITGPWKDVAGATSPYKFTPTEQALFGRIKR